MPPLAPGQAVSPRGLGTLGSPSCPQSSLQSGWSWCGSGTFPAGRCWLPSARPGRLHSELGAERTHRGRDQRTLAHSWALRNNQGAITLLTPGRTGYRHRETPRCHSCTHLVPILGSVLQEQGKALALRLGAFSLPPVSCKSPGKWLYHLTPAPASVSSSINGVVVIR